MISIIIPVYNERRNIARLEEMLRSLKGDFEVIFSDGFSTDGTYESITMNKIQETKSRALQMNVAAKVARGEYLWFLHADSVVDPSSLFAIENSDADCGCFKLRFDWKHPLMRLIAWGSNLRVRWGNLAFGDQGIFMKREFFEKMGGFPAIPLMEDYEFSRMLRKKEKRYHVLPYYIETSARRYRDHGILTTFFYMQSLKRRYRRGDSVARMAEDYNDGK